MLSSQCSLTAFLLAEIILTTVTGYPLKIDGSDVLDLPSNPWDDTFTNDDVFEGFTDDDALLQYVRALVMNDGQELDMAERFRPKLKGNHGFGKKEDLTLEFPSELKRGHHVFGRRSDDMDKSQTFDGKLGKENRGPFLELLPQVKFIHSLDNIPVGMPDGHFDEEWKRDTQPLGGYSEEDYYYSALPSEMKRSNHVFGKRYDGMAGTGYVSKAGMKRGNHVFGKRNDENDTSHLQLLSVIRRKSHAFGKRSSEDTGQSNYLEESEWKPSL